MGRKDIMTDRVGGEEEEEEGPLEKPAPFVATHTQTGEGLPALREPISRITT